MSALVSARQQLELLVGALRRQWADGNGNVSNSHWQRPVQAWLRDSFAPAIVSWLNLLEFREAVMWSRNTFAPDSQHPLRQVATELSTTLQNAVRLIGREQDWWERTQVENPALVQQSKERLQAIINRENERRQSRAEGENLRENVATLLMRPVDLSQTLQSAEEYLRQAFPVNPHRPLQAVDLASITEPLWRDLVNVEDFLWPSSQWNLLPDALPVQTAQALNGTFLSSHESDLVPEHDLVVRSLVCRARSWLEKLNEASRSSLISGLFTMGPVSQARGVVLNKATGLLAQLESACVSSAEAQRRESCVVIFKVALATTGVPPVDWTVFQNAERLFFTTQINHALNASLETSLRVLTRMNLAIEHLLALSEVQATNTDRIAEKIQAGGLVLNAVTREVYWEGKQVDLGQSSQNWEMLTSLAEQAKKCQSTVSFQDISGINDTSSTLSTRISRLKNKLPSTLRVKITAIRGEGAYRLQLDHDQINIFGRE